MSSVWNWQPQEPACSLRPAGLIRLEGADARRVLHGQTSAAIETAPPGFWVSTCCITATARLRALAEVLVDQEGAWLVVHAGDGQQVHSALDRVLFPADRVRLGPVEAAWWLTPVAGQEEQLEGAQVPSWRSLAGERGWQLGGGGLGQALVLRDPEPQSWPERWRQRRLLDSAEQERWRLQQGLPAAPGELNDDHNPFELGLAERVNLNKGCYVGQETLAKLATYDGVRQQLRRWHWCPAAAGQPPEVGPEVGDELRSAAHPGDGTRLGRLTSKLELATGERIGLAMVRRAGLAEQRLRAGAGGQEATVTVSRPGGFVDPPRGAGGTAQPAAS